MSNGKGLFGLTDRIGKTGLPSKVVPNIPVEMIRSNRFQIEISGDLGFITSIGRFILEALSVQTDNLGIMPWSSLYYNRIIRLDLLVGKTFLGRLVMPQEYKDGHKKHYASRRTFLLKLYVLSDALRNVVRLDA